MDHDIAAKSYARRNDAAFADKCQAGVESGRQLRIGAVIIGMADARVLTDARLLVNHTAFDDRARFDNRIIENDTVAHNRPLPHLHAGG